MNEKIDKKIKGVISAFNRLGITTTGSCQGHIDYGAPAPWIKISPREKPYTAETKRLRKETILLLGKFYENKKVESAVKLKVKNGKFGFWLYSGGQDFLVWRRVVKENVEKVRKNQSVGKTISLKEKQRHRKNLPVFQKEMRLFGDFLSRIR